MNMHLPGTSSLIHATKEGDLHAVKKLVEVLHVDPHTSRDEDNSTPLHWASRRGFLNVVKYLVEERHCDVECRNKDGDTPLHAAALAGKLDIVQYLISDRGCDPMSKGQYGGTPLHCACQSGRVDVVSYLMEDSPKVDSLCRNENNDTPLHVASFNGHLPVVKLLVEDYLCDPSVTVEGGQTPADLAQSKGHTAIAFYLSAIEKTVCSEYILLNIVYNLTLYISFHLQLTCAEL